MQTTVINLSLQEVIGRGYKEFMRSKLRYNVVKGSRASKKSTTASIKLIKNLMQYPESNALVVRQTAVSLKDSCYAQLKWAQQRLRVGHLWRNRVSPLEMEYLPTGQKILFRGLDDPMKVTSITVPHGVLNFGWVEEAYEIDEASFQMLDESLRGELPRGYFVQWLITFNPWDSSSWLKARFFDTPHDDTLAMTTTYKCNEWLSGLDLQLFESMKNTDPERYQVAGLGDWGVAAGRFFTQWDGTKHVVEPFALPDKWVRFRAMDWGSAKPYCCLWFAVDYDGVMYCYRELYGYGGRPNVGTQETAKQVAEKIAAAEPKGEKIDYAVLDSACWAKTGVSGPSIGEEINNTLIDKKRMSFGKSSKGRAEGSNAIKERLVGNGGKPALVFFRSCVNTIRTLPQLAHDKHKPEVYDTSAEDHACDAVAYACLSRPWTPTVPKPKKRHDAYAIHPEEEDSGWAF